MLRAIQMLAILLLPILSFSQAPWINEIHYDNSSGDVNEGIEVAGPAGTNLACYELIPYNGNGGVSYSNTALSGTIPDEGCGYGAIWFPIAGLQNGAPDGIALYDNCTNTLISLLSYEGTFVAVSAPATGANSTDIGVAETSSTPIGESLQLTGSGNNSGAFSWTGPSAASPGTLNTGQTIAPCGAANTITSGAVSGGPFTVNCTNSTSDAGTIDFTSSGTFNAGNVYSVELSDASGSFATPTVVGTLTSTANTGTISFTLPSTLASGTGYLMRIVSDDPIVTGSTSTTSIQIIQAAPCVSPTPTGTGVIINEWSNGPSGNQEFYEFVVAGQCGTLVDIRGYILDDNNGTFTAPASYSGTSSGIANGHFRFANAAQWSSIPVGSLIVVYNSDDPNPALPADDPTDANNDSLYVVPHDDVLFERCTTLPAPTAPDSVYSPCTYATAPLNGWGPLSLRNSGDAIQVRNPDGSYYHGVSYGGSEMTGGPNNLKLFTGSGSGMMGWFSDGDFFDAAQWNSGPVSAGTETPGLPNNAANAAWLVLMRDPSAASCPIVVLPVELINFGGKRIDNDNLLYWQTQTEINSSFFTLERSTDLKEWDVISIEPAAGNSQDVLGYSFMDRGYEDGMMNYYRLSQTDFDGTTKTFNKTVSIDDTELDVKLVKIVNLLGQEISQDTPGVQIHVYSNGTSEKVFKL
ncbi:MAG: hypothetical protein CSA03_02840 [Bacteroidetes bacterium]|nr:MAG: hypothetical protein CSA03_02840 [Bacteroidota bacterium]